MRAKLEAQESFNILATTLELLELFWIHGSHIALEQPETAMSWSEPIVHSLDTTARIVPNSGGPVCLG